MFCCLLRCCSCAPREMSSFSWFTTCALDSFTFLLVSLYFSMSFSTSSINFVSFKRSFSDLHSVSSLWDASLALDSTSAMHWRSFSMLSSISLRTFCIFPGESKTILDLSSSFFLFSSSSLAFSSCTLSLISLDTLLLVLISLWSTACSLFKVLSWASSSIVSFSSLRVSSSSASLASRCSASSAPRRLCSSFREASLALKPSLWSCSSVNRESFSSRNFAKLMMALRFLLRRADSGLYRSLTREKS
mmetsp:Transcript_11195/g.31213  ORF Transcript_11195/g.31213 Transcript_11195/m.31213 type:complete len:247 (-) Transcript_11195:368-1108(-)